MTTRLVFLQCSLALVLMVDVCNGQGFVSNVTNGAVKKDPERGVIFSVTPVHDDTLHLIHIPVMPYYEPVRRPSSYPAYQFGNPAVDFLSVDVDFRDKTLFLFERDSRSILAATNYTAPVSQKNPGTVYYLNVGVSNGAVQIAYDWLSKTLYWVDSAFRWVAATNGDMSRYLAEDFLDFNQYKIIVSKDLEHPEGVSLDPHEGLLFISDNGRHPKIERANLDGSGRVTLLDRGVGRPESLEADFLEKRIYWVDQAKETIEYMNYDGTGLKRLRLLAGTVLGDLGIFKEVLIVTDTTPGRAHFLNKTSGEELWPRLEFKDNYMYGVCVYNIEAQPLKEISGKNCSELACEQLCVSTSTSPKCICFEGFEWDASDESCKESEPSTYKSLVLATDTLICLADIRHLNTISPYLSIYCPFWTLYQEDTTTTPNPTTDSSADPNVTTTTETPYNPYTDPANSIKMFDVNTRKRMVYYVAGDNSIYGRPIDIPYNDTSRQFIVSAAGTIKGIVYDWVNKNNLYWVQSDSTTSPAIYRVDITTLSTEKVQDITGSPSNLVMLYRTRRLAWWSKTTSGSQELMTMNTDKTNMKTVVSRPSDYDISTLVVDDEKQLFYWIEGPMVHSIHYDGNDEVTVVTSLVIASFELLLLYQNYLLWGVPTSTSGTIFQSFQIDTSTLGTQGSFDAYSIFVDVKALDIALTPETLSDTNPCFFENGGCDQICINQYSGSTLIKKCHCTLGYTLQSDGLTCQSDHVNQDYALITDITHGRIYQIDLVNDVTYALNYRESAIYETVFYNRLTEEVVWTESTSSYLYAGNIDSSNEHIIDKRATGQPVAIALDETTCNLYYADNTFPYFSSVLVLTPQGHGFEFLDNQTVYRERIVAMDVHPHRGWLYVAVRSDYFSSYLLRANLDGSNVTRADLRTHVPEELFPVIEGFVIDHVADQIYWSDNSQNVIYRCDLELIDCQVFHRSSIAAMRELDTDGEYLYYTSWNYHHLKRVSLADGSETELGVSIELGKTESVSVYRTAAMNKQKVSKPCEARNGRGNCSTICFPTQTGRRCACETNITLLADDRTCSNVIQCVQTFTDGNQKQISMDPDCLRYEGEDCKYVCPAYFAPVLKRPNNDVTLRCKNDTTWDRRSEQLCAPVDCPHTITNGRIADDCAIAAGRSCKFMCQSGHYKNPAVTGLSCLSNGKWNLGPNIPCLDVYCPSTVMNGIIDDQCDRTVTSTCGYTCNMNYRKTSQNVISLVCETQGTWNQTSNLCEEITCPASFSGLQIDSGCNRKIGSNCAFTCLSTFNKHPNVSRVACSRQGTWHNASDLCISSVPPVTLQSKQSSGTNTTGIGVGITLGVVALIALVLLLVLCRKRLGVCGGSQKELPSASFTNSPPDGITNPGYLTADIRVTDDGYDQRSIPDSERAYSTISETGSRKGLKKYFYGNKETLPDKKEIESPQKQEVEVPKSGTKTMTAEEWLKQGNKY